MQFNVCGFTKLRNNYWRKSIQKHFPSLATPTHDDFLSIIEYINIVPQTFYSKKTYSDYLAFLINIKNNHPKILRDFFVAQKRDLNLALKILAEINGQTTHDSIFSFDEPQIYLTLNNIATPNYLRLIEGVYAEFIFPIALLQLRDERKGEDCLSEIHGRVQTLERTTFAYLLENYSSTVRNGIAHGDVSFEDHEVVFKDKRGTEKHSHRDVVRMSDRLLDQCNGMSAALKTFVAMESADLATAGLPIPRQILVDELRYPLSFEHWQIIDVAESTFDRGRSQINIFIKNNFLDPDSVTYYCFKTVEQVERLLPGYQRYFLSLESPAASRSWASFDGPKLRTARLKPGSTREDVVVAIENGAVFYFPNFKLPQSVRKILRFSLVMRTHFKLMIETFFPSFFTASLIKTHRNGGWSVVTGDVNCRNINLESGPVLVRKNLKKIVRQALKEARKGLFWYDPCRLLPLGLLHIGVYSSPLRARQFKTGLISDLICSIELKRLKRIEKTDMMGTIEQIGKYRIVWNDNYGSSTN